MSNQVGIRELRQNASAVMRRVAAGEVVEVTDHGHPVARIVPLVRSNLDQLVLEGRASAGEGDLLELLEAMDLPRPPATGQLVSQALEELRAELPAELPAPEG